MKSRYTFPLLTWMLFSIVACSKGGSEIYSAPHQAADTGLIVKISAQKASSEEQEQLNAVLSQPGVTFRTLSERHGNYEVFGLNEQEVKELAPALHVERNVYFKSIVPVKHPSQKFMDFMAKLDGEEPGNTDDVSASAVPPILETCDLQAQEKPTVQIDLDFTLDPQTMTLELGDQVSFNGKNSKAHPSHPSMLTLRWLVMAPGSSEITDEVRPGQSLKFKTDNVGLYQVVLVAEDNRRACGVDSSFFLVSYNPDLELPTAGDKKPTVELKHFTHLNYVDAQNAWGKSTGAGVTIAVLDTGLNFNHRAIAWNLAVNKAELNGVKGQDDDGNEFKDDQLGWDFVNGDNNPFDDEGHGSHVSGIAASHIFGISKDAKILPIKVLNAFGGGDVASIVAGIYFAVDSGADVINASLGSAGTDFKALEDAIKYAKSKNVVFVAAAGNGDRQGIGLDLSKAGNDIYPAELNVSNILTVAATDEHGALTSYSNYGFNEVDVAAPGGSGTEPIWSLATQNAKGNNFAPSAGTSMASPLVAGVVGLVLEVRPSATPQDIIDTLVMAGTASTPLKGKVRSEKVISASMAIELSELPLM